MSQKDEVRNLGLEYQYKVITYVAARLLKNEDVDDFTIYSNFKGIESFDDLIVKVSFKDNKFEPHCYLGQIKHRLNKSNPIASKTRELNLDKYLKEIDYIINERNDIEVLQDIEKKNVVFWFFTNNTIVDTLFTWEGTYSKTENKECNSILHPIGSTCHKLKRESGTNNPDMDKLHFILNQPNNDEIRAKIKKLCFERKSAEMADNLINFVHKYFNAHKEFYLTKRIFEIEIFRICLSEAIVKPTLAVEMNEEHARLWNAITSLHEITVINQVPNMKRNVFGCFWSKINDIMNCELDWNNRIEQGGTITSVERKVEDYLKSKSERQWNIVPDCIGSLVEIMWKYDDVPLLLQTSDTTLLQKYKHLNKHFIVIGDVKKICNQLREFPRKIFTDVASIESDDLRNTLLREIIVSLQGRKPTPIYNIVFDNQEAMKELTSSIILRLIKKRSLFLQEGLLDNSVAKIIYIIVVDEIESEYDFEEIDYESSIVIKCTDFEEVKEKIKTHPKLQYYKQCHIRLSDDKYEPLIPDQIHEETKNFAIDQDGEAIYGFGDHRLAPVIGERLKSSKPNYIQRHFSTTTLEKTILSRGKGQVIFLGGDLSSLSLDTSNTLITECEEIELLGRNENALVDANDIAIEPYWSRFPSRELLHLSLEDGCLELRNHRNCANLKEYVSPYRRKFEECKFFQQNLNPIIVSGEPGIGKSSLLASLAEKYDEKSYVLFCNLSNYRSELQGDTHNLLHCPLDFIFGESTKPPYEKLLKKVYEHHLENGILILFLDSFDEILPYYKKNVLRILKRISELNVKFVISSRTHANHILAEKLEMEPIMIEELNRKDVEKYLQKENITEINFERIPDQFLKNPLYLHFLISLLQEDSLNFTEMDTFDLYKKCIYKKIERYHKKYNLDFNRVLKDLIRSTLKQHRLLALIAIFREKALEKPSIDREYKTLTKEDKEIQCKFGFIKYFDKDDFPVFSHETFAEFLAVEWIVENIGEEPGLEIYKQIISNLNYDFQNFFDSMVCKDLKLHKAILKLDVKRVGELCTEHDNLEKVDRFGRSALHLVSMYYAKYFHLDKVSTNIRRILDIIIGCMRKDEIDTGKRDFIMEWSWIESMFKCKNSVMSYEEFLKYELYRAVSTNIRRIMDIIIGCMRKDEIDTGKRDFIMEWRGIEGMYKCKNSVMSYEDFLEYELYRAVIFNSENYVYYLLDVEKLSINSNRHHYTPALLLLAAETASVDLVKSLINRGADIAITDSIGGTVLHHAAKNKQPNVIEYLLDLSLININQIDINGKTPLHLACKWSNFNAIAALLDKGADPNITDKDGKNVFLPIIFYQYDNREDIFLVLDKFIEHNINLEQKDKFGNTVLHDVCSHERKDLLCYLLKKLGAQSLSNRNNEGKTPFHVACMEGDITIVEYLIEEHPKVLPLVDNFGNTCLHFAARCENESVLFMLLDKMGYSENTNIEIRNHSGETLLHASVECDSYDVTDFLLGEGHDPNLVDENGYTALHTAISKRKHSMATFFLSNGADVNAKDYKGRTPLDLAIMNYNSCTIDAILDKCEHFDAPLDLTKKFNLGNTLLHYACQNWHENAVHYLLENIRKDDVHIRNEEGKTPFHLACESGNREIVEILLDYSLDVIELDKEGNTCLHLTAKSENERLFFILANKMGLTRSDRFELRNNLGETPLHIAAGWSGFITKFLLDGGHDPNLVDKNGYTALHTAILKEMRSIVTICLRMGADVNAKDIEGRTPLDLAIMNYNSDIVDAILDKCKHFDAPLDLTKKFNLGNTLLHYACQNLHENAVRYLLKNIRKDDVHIRNDRGKTPFHLACESGNSKIVEILFDCYGLEVMELDKERNTCFHLAAKSGNEELFFILADKMDLMGNDSFELRNSLDETLLHIAAGCSSLITKFLLDRGHDPNVVDKDRNTPLHMAACLGDTSSGWADRNKYLAIDVLIQKGADINARNKDLETPLHRAVKKVYPNYYCIEKLLQNGADVNAKDVDGNTALHICLMNKYCIKDKWRMLIRFGADLEITNNENKTPLDVAKWHNKHDFLLDLEKKESWLRVQ